MGYKVTAPLVIIPNADGASSDWYGYDGAVVPTGLNDERCKQLAKEGMLEKVKDAKASAGSDDTSGSKSGSDNPPKPPAVAAVKKEVGDDKEKAQAALDAELALPEDAQRSSLVEHLNKVLAAGSE